MQPDFLTVFALTATSAFTLAWVMAALGQKFWRQGMAWITYSTLLYGGAYSAFAVMSVSGQSQWGALGSSLVSAALGTFTAALQAFRQNVNPRRDAISIVAPVLASLALGLAFLPSNPGKFYSIQSGVVTVQALCALLVLVRVRHLAPGSGWVLVTAATAAHAVSNSVVLLTPTALGHTPSLAHTLLLWVLCLTLLLRLVVSAIGFFIMLHNRQSALEKGKSQIDPLTQLPNRAALVITLEEAIHHSAEHEQSLAIMVLDIDHFKSVNDTYGHLVGDKVIQHLAAILKQHGRSNDFAARYGGEEFVLVLPNTSTRNAFTYAESLCQAVRKAPLTLPSGQMLHITISIGVYAGTPAHGSNWQRLVGVADEAMYVAKRSGRDRVAMSAPVQAMQAQRPAMH